MISPNLRWAAHPDIFILFTHRCKENMTSGLLTLNSRGCMLHAIENTNHALKESSTAWQEKDSGKHTNRAQMSQATWMSTTSWSLCRTWGQDWHESSGLFTRSHGLITWPSPLIGPTKHPQSSRFKFIDQGYAICLIMFNDQGNDGKLDCPNVIPFHNHLNKWYPNILQHSSPKTTRGLLDCKQHLHAIWHIEWSMRGLFNLFKTAVINRSEHSDAQNLYRCNGTESLIKDNDKS